MGLGPRPTGRNKVLQQAGALAAELVSAHDELGQVDQHGTSLQYGRTRDRRSRHAGLDSPLPQPRAPLVPGHDVVLGLDRLGRLEVQAHDIAIARRSSGTRGRPRSIHDIKRVGSVGGIRLGNDEVPRHAAVSQSRVREFGQVGESPVRDGPLAGVGRIKSLLQDHLGRVDDPDSWIVGIQHVALDDPVIRALRASEHHGPPARVLLGRQAPQQVREAKGLGELPVGLESAHQHTDVDVVPRLGDGVGLGRRAGLGGDGVFAGEGLGLLDQVVFPRDGVAELDGFAQGGAEVRAPLFGGLEDVTLAPLVEGVDEEEVLLALRVGVDLDAPD